MGKDFIDPDVLDLLAASDIASPIKDKFVAALHKMVDRGVGITELEQALAQFLAQQSVKSDSSVFTLLRSETTTC